MGVVDWWLGGLILICWVCVSYHVMVLSHIVVGEVIGETLLGCCWYFGLYGRLIYVYVPTQRLSWLDIYELGP